MAQEQVLPEHVSLALKIKGAVSPASPVVVLCATGLTYNQGRETTEIRCLGQVYNAANPEYGSFSANFSLTGTYRVYLGGDEDTNVGFQHLSQWIKDGETLSFIYKVETASGDITESGDCLVTSLSAEHTDGPATYSTDFSVKGIPTTVITEAA